MEAKNLNLLNTIVDKNELRFENRFEVLDSAGWHVSLASKRLPSKWLVNLSEEGASIRVGKRNPFRVGEKLELVIRYQDDTVVRTLATIKWRKPYEKSLNMDQVGVEFEPEAKFSSLPLRSPVLQHTELKIMANSKKLQEEEMKKRGIKPHHYVMCAALMYTCGFVMGALF